MAQYLVQRLTNFGELTDATAIDAAMQDGLNAIASLGWTLIHIQAHPFETVGGEPVVLTVWSK